MGPFVVSRPVLGKSKKIVIAKKVGYRFRRPGLANKVKKLQKVVNRMKPETKHYDIPGGISIPINNNVGATGTSNIMPLVPITQGMSDYGERIGDQIRLKRLYINGAFVLNSGLSYSPVRVTIFYDKYNPDAAVAPVTVQNEYFQSAVDNTGYMPYALRDWDNSASFHTIYDKTFMLKPTTAVGSPADESGSARLFRLSLPLKGKLVQYFNNGTGVCRNQLYVVFTTIADANVTFTGVWRITYTDA